MTRRPCRTPPRCVSSAPSKPCSKSRSPCWPVSVVCGERPEADDMDFAITDDQQLIADSARKVGQRFGLDYWREHDARKEFPAEFWKAVCAAGLCGVALPERYGGAGLGMVEMALIVEQLAAAGGGSTVGQ